MARPALITDKRIRDIIIGARRLGFSCPQVCNAAGISTQTLRRTLARGRKKKEQEADTVYAQFARDYDAATEVGILTELNKIKKAANKHWQASAWLLERIHPDRFGRATARVEVEQPGDGEEQGSKVVVYIPDNGRD